MQELQSSLDTGAPLDELKGILGEIRKRLQDAAAADDIQAQAHAEQCDDWLTKLDGWIKDTRADILRLDGEINQTENTIKSLENQVKSSQEAIKSMQDEVKGWNKDIVNLNATRANDKEIYDNRTRDTGICKRAIQEIFEVPGFDKLAANQEKDADTYSEKYYQTAETMPTTLLALADKVQDRKAKDLVLLAAAAVSTLSKGDVDSLKGLLRKLDTELTTYQTELNTDEAQSIRIYESELAAFQKLIADKEQDIIDEQGVLAGLEKDLRNARNKLKNLQAERKAAQDKLNDLLEDKKQSEAKCGELERAYEERKKDRRDEFDTLDAIEKIIKDQLDKTADHVLDAVEDVTVQE